MDAKAYSKKYIDEYNLLVTEIEYMTEKRIPILKEMGDRRNDLSCLWLALAGNPHSEDGKYLHGQPFIYHLMESYHQAKSAEEAEQRYEKADEYIAKCFNRNQCLSVGEMDKAILIASWKE